MSINETYWNLGNQEQSTAIDVYILGDRCFTTQVANSNFAAAGSIAGEIAGLSCAQFDMAERIL